MTTEIHYRTINYSTCVWQSVFSLCVEWLDYTMAQQPTIRGFLKSQDDIKSCGWLAIYRDQSNDNSSSVKPATEGRCYPYS